MAAEVTHYAATSNRANGDIGSFRSIDQAAVVAWAEAEQAAGAQVVNCSVTALGVVEAQAMLASWKASAPTS